MILSFTFVEECIFSFFIIYFSIISTCELSKIDFVFLEWIIILV
jgi:hypothetical protein